MKTIKLLDLRQNHYDMIDKIYCLNLESSQVRKTAMKKVFSKHNMNVDFVKAIHPRSPEYKKILNDPNKVDRLGFALRCFCQKECDHRVRKLRPTEIAISLSHLSIYKLMVKDNIEWAMVCEDDIRFIDNFKEIVGKQISQLRYTQEPCIVCLGGHMDNIGLKINDPIHFELIRQKQGSYSNYCYILNNKAAKVLIKNFFPIRKPEDSYKRLMIVKNKIEGWRIKPSLVGELSAGRNIKPIYDRLSQFRTGIS